MGTAELLKTLQDLTPAQTASLRTEVQRTLDKRLLERSLAAFTRAAWHVLEPSRPLTWNWHLDTMCGYLEALAARTITRLIINVPPGSTKSLLASVMFPAWTWATDPSHRFLCGSNEDTLATRDSLKMRRLIASDWYQGLWREKVCIATDQREKTYFENAASGFRQSQGVRAAVTGKRGDTIIWDDPHDTKQIESDVMRQAVLDSWDQAWSNRKNDPATSGVLFIMQRIHERDIVGYALEKEGQDWKQLVIPMRYDGERYDAGEDICRPELNDPRTEEGELFFPERFPAQVVDEAEQDLGPYGTAGQHQQRPSPKGGGELKPEWFVRYKSKPDDGKGLRFILVDPAGERKPGRLGKKDFTAIGVIEARADGNLYLLDAVRDRLNLTERTDLLFDWCRQYKPRLVGYERYGKDSDIAHIQDRMERDQYRFRIVELGGGLRKEDRIRRLIPRLARSGFWFPETLPKVLTDGALIDVMEQVINQEAKSFPVAPYDDFLDMLSRVEDLAEQKLLLFPSENTRVPRTMPRPRRNKTTWMAI